MNGTSADLALSLGRAVIDVRERGMCCMLSYISSEYQKAFQTQLILYEFSIVYHGERLEDCAGIRRDALATRIAQVYGCIACNQRARTQVSSMHVLPKIKAPILTLIHQTFVLIGRKLCRQYTCVCYYNPRELSLLLFQLQVIRAQKGVFWTYRLISLSSQAWTSSLSNKPMAITM